MDARLEEAIERVKNSKYCFGICSNVDDKRHVLFFDFDGDISLKQVEESLKRTMLVYQLSDIYILKSDNGYNAFCLNIFDFNYVYAILKNTDFVCEDFTRLGFEKRGFYVLRMCFNKHYIKTIEGYHVDHNHLSDAHRWFFTEVMNFPINNNGFFELNTSFKIIAYKSSKHGSVELDEN